jgi:hypothetical protein
MYRESILSSELLFAMHKSSARWTINFCNIVYVQIRQSKLDLLKEKKTLMDKNGSFFSFQTGKLKWFCLVGFLVPP